MEIFDLTGPVDFSPERHVSRSLAKTPLSALSVIGWEPGQVSSIHFHPGADEVYHVLQGEGLFDDGQRHVRLGPGHAVMFRAGAGRRRARRRPSRVAG